MDRNRYAEIMAQYQQAQPFSFTGYPSTYTGGYNVSQPQQYIAPVNSYADIMEQSAMTGPGGRVVDYNPTWTAMSDAEKATFYANNPSWAKVTQIGQNLFSNTGLLGLAQKYGNPDFVSNQNLIAKGIIPTTVQDSGPPNMNALFTTNLGSVNTVRDPAQAAQATGGFVPVTPQQIAAEAAAREAARQPIRESSQSDGEDGGSGKGNGAITGGGGMLSSQSSATRAALRTGTGYYEGGHVTMQHLQGPDPMGPDDGYAALKDGEFVINDKAVKKYGIELMQAINSGKISKGKLLGLLEM